MPATDHLEQVLEDIEHVRERDAEPSLEAELSVNDWIDRIRVAAQTAQGAARAGVVRSEYDTWIEIASIAAGRAEQLFPQIR